MEVCEEILIPWPLREPWSSRKEAEESAESLSTSPDCVEAKSTRPDRVLNDIKRGRYMRCKERR